MEERQVVGRRRARGRCPTPFLVAATQNPVEYEGTYPLPEAQLDRFLLKLTLPLPAARRRARGAAPARRRLRPARPGRRRRAPGGRRRRPGRRPRRRPHACTCPPEVLGYIVDLARATRAAPSLQLGVSPRGATGAARHRPGLGLAGRPRLRHPRRRQGAGPARPCGTGSGCAPRPSSRASPSTACWTACSPPCPCPAETVAITGRAAAARCCSGVRRRWRSAPGRGRRCSAVAGAGAAARPRRLALAPGPAHGLTVERELTAAVRLGEPADDRRCWSTNTGSAGRCAAWCATPGSRPPGRRDDTGTGSVVPGGRAALLRTALQPHPARRPAAPTRVTVRSLGPLGLAAGSGTRRRRRDACGCCRRSTPASTCRASWPGCASSTAARRSGCAARAPSSTRCASTCVGDDVRSIDWRASARARATSWCAPGGRSATGGVVCRARHRPHLGRPGRRRAPARRRDGRRAAARRAGLAGRRPGRPARRRPPGPRPGARGGDRRGAAARAGRPRWPRCEPALVETDWPRWSSRRSLRRRPAARPRRAAHRRWSRPRSSEGLLPVLPLADPPAPGGARLGARPAGRRARGRARRRRRGVRRGRGRAAPRWTSGRVARAARASASTWSTRPPTGSRPRLADHYLALKARRPALTGRRRATPRRARVRRRSSQVAASSAARRRSPAHARGRARRRRRGRPASASDADPDPRPGGQRRTASRTPRSPRRPAAPRPARARR